MRHHIRPRVGALLLGLAALTLVLALAPLAALAQQSEEARAPTTLRASAQPARLAGHLMLSATLTTADGKPLNNRVVDFYQLVTFFGEREAHLGSAITDSTGLATLLYQPAQTGPQDIKAHFAGATGLRSAATTTAVDVRQVVVPFHTEPLPLAAVRQWLPAALGAVVLGTWVVLLGTFITTALRIRAAGRAGRGAIPTPTERARPEEVAPRRSSLSASS